MSAAKKATRYTASHWGIYELARDGDGRDALRGWRADPAPSPIGLHMLEAGRARLQSGAPFRYNGGHYHYPSIKLVYWCGGNPFHHHQHLNRLAEAWWRPDTIIVHEQFWNPQAKMADIVLPATTTLERDDIGKAARPRAAWCNWRAGKGRCRR